MNVRHYWPTLTRGGVLLALLALARLVRDAPLQWGVVRIDSLTVFFACATLAALALMPRRAPLRVWCVAALLLVAFSVTLTPLVAALFALVATWSVRGEKAPEPGARSEELDVAPPVVGRWSSLIEAARQLLSIALPLVIAASLLVGYGALALNGALHYDDRAAGTALNSLVFWFVLLPAVIVVTPLAELHVVRPQRWFVALDQLVTIGWCYPLVRLYSLGPWNTGWNYAALLLGGAAALWSATAALTARGANTRLAHIRRGLAALALAGFGLGTSAGIAAGCYGMLALLVVAAGQEPGARSQEISSEAPGDLSLTFSSSYLLTFSPALVLVAPFVAVWMLVGAALAGGAQALVGAAWLAALIGAVALLVDGLRVNGARFNSILSLVLGVGAPLVVLWLIEPVIEQLQGGLTAYGDVVIWPWIGLAIKNSANTQIAVLPSLVVAALLVVLAAIVYLVARVREPQVVSDEAAPVTAPAEPSRQTAFITLLRAEIPWLDLVLPAERNGAPHNDGK